MRNIRDIRIGKHVIAGDYAIIMVAIICIIGAFGGGMKIGHNQGFAEGYENGRYAMRQHIDNVRWVKTFNTWADAYDLYMADVQKKIAAGEPVSDKDRAAFAKEPKIDRKKTFGEIGEMAKSSAGKDPLEAHWLKVNGFTD